MKWLRKNLSVETRFARRGALVRALVCTCVVAIALLLKIGNMQGGAGTESFAFGPTARPLRHWRRELTVVSLRVATTNAYVILGRGEVSNLRQVLVTFDSEFTP